MLQALREQHGVPTPGAAARVNPYNPAPPTPPWAYEDMGRRTPSPSGRTLTTPPQSPLTASGSTAI
eukprot:9177429-Lingulodinium_polyedra.AAC.1